MDIAKILKPNLNHIYGRSTKAGRTHFERRALGHTKGMFIMCMNFRIKKRIFQKAAALITGICIATYGFGTYGDLHGVFAAESESAQTIEYMKFSLMNSTADLNGASDVDFENVREFKVSADKSHLYVASDDEIANKLEILANGENERYKFDIKWETDGYISIKLKTSKDKAGEPLFRLRDSAVYSIYIPKGVFMEKNANGEYVEYAEKTFCFATKTKGEYADGGILNEMTPSGKEDADSNTEKIELDFLDEIAFVDGVKLEQGIVQNASDYMTIKSSHKKTGSSPSGYNIEGASGANDSISDYEVSIEGSKLILKSKNKKLRDFAKYEIELKEKFVYLKKSENAKRIYNKMALKLGFETGRMLKSSIPANNSESVSIEPSIELEFKEDIVFVPSEEAKANIALKEDDSQKIEIPLENININEDNKKILSIDIKDDAKQTNRLRRSTLYTLTVPAGTVQFKNYGNYVNEQIKITFITESDGDNPAPLFYSSNENASDDITSVQNSKLQSDGSIYVHMDREVRKDKEYGDKEPEDAVKLWKIPAPYSKGYDGDGILRDKSFDYLSLNGQMVGNFSLYEEVPVEGFEVGGDGSKKNLIKIIPKRLEEYKIEDGSESVSGSKKGILEPLSIYKLQIDKRYVEDENGYNPVEDIVEYFWTGPSDKVQSTAVDWDMSKATATTISEVEDAPYKSFKLYGTPAYSPKSAQDKPIVVYVNGKANVNISDLQPEEIVSENRFRAKSLEKIMLMSSHYPQKEFVAEKGLSNISMQLGQTMSVELGDSTGLKNEEKLSWISLDENVVIADDDGKLYAVGKGSADIDIVTAGGQKAFELHVDVLEETKAAQVQVEYENMKGYEAVTKLSIYPNETLKSGKGYVLIIPKGVFISENGQELGNLRVEFTVGADKTKDMGVYDVQPAQISLSGIVDESAEFSVNGYNFYEDVEYIRIKGTTAERPSFEIKIDPEDIKFRSVEKLDFTITGDDKDMLVSEIGNKAYDYKVYVKFKDRAEMTNDMAKFSISTNLKPQITATYPVADSIFDEASLERYDSDLNGKSFVRIELDNSQVRSILGTDISINGKDGKLGLEALEQSSVKAVGSSENLVDKVFIEDVKNKEDYYRQQYIESYIFKKDSSGNRCTLYIPLKSRLESNTEYEFALAGGVVTSNSEGLSVNEDELNSEYVWRSSTTGTPVVTKVLTGTVQEDYESGEYIVIRGVFGKKPVVYFLKGTEEFKAAAVTLSEDAGEIKVKLPTGSDALEAGVYDIKILNDSNHEYTLYSALTVAKRTDLDVGPTEVLKESGSKGDIVQSVQSSLGIIKLKSKYSDTSKLKLDISDLGIDQRSVQLQFDADEGDGVGEIVLEYDGLEYVKIYDAKLNEDSDDAATSIFVGEADPSAEDMVKRKLLMLTPKSKLFQVKCENMNVNGVEIVLPYDSSYGNNLKVLRYDFETRGLYEVRSYYIERTESTAKILSDQPGIFVVIEEY